MNVTAPQSDEAKLQIYSQLRRKLKVCDTVMAEYATKMSPTPEAEEKRQKTVLKTAKQAQEINASLSQFSDAEVEKFEQMIVAQGGKEFKSKCVPLQQKETMTAALAKMRNFVGIVRSRLIEQSKTSKG